MAASAPNQTDERDLKPVSQHQHPHLVSECKERGEKKQWSIDLPRAVQVGNRSGTHQVVEKPKTPAQAVGDCTVVPHTVVKAAPAQKGPLSKSPSMLNTG